MEKPLAPRPQQNDAQEEAQLVVDRNAAQDQYGVSQTPFHTHNGADSNRVSFSDIRNRLQVESVVLAGTAPATAGNYGVFFTAPFPCRLVAASECHATAGSDASSVTVQVERLTGTTAPGSGTALLASGFNMKGTANTVQYGTLASIQKTSFTLAKGDRLALKLTGTPTAVANAVFMVTLSY